MPMKKARPFIRQIGSKWTKTKILLLNKEIRPYVPTTQRMNKQSLRDMLNQYAMVYVKPEHGTMGLGVIRVEKFISHGRNVYRFQSGFRAYTFQSYDAMYHILDKIKLKRTYLVQKGIRLLKYQKRPFDIRVMVQQSPAGQWETTGIIGRLAQPRKIVTNYHSGGTPLPIETLLTPYMPQPKKAGYNRMLGGLGHKIATHFNRTHPGFKEFGIDIGIDPTLKPWIIEINSRPDPYIFNQLKDKRMYRKIYRYAKAYGRIR
jgi:hypothetical protein